MALNIGPADCCTLYIYSSGSSRTVFFEMNEALFHRLCYIFPATGQSDLKMCVRPGNQTISVFFFQTTPAYPHPRNAFFGVDGDASRYNSNMEVYNRIMAEQPVQFPVPLSTVEVFLSLANCRRAVLERGGSDASSDLNWPCEQYLNSILLSRDEYAIRSMRIIGKRVKHVTICSTDDGLSALVPVNVRALVAEAFAGLSIISYHQGNICLSVSYATCALFKHACALPFVNCVRLAALSKNDIDAVLMITEMVLLPFYLRSTDPAMCKLYHAELAIWDPHTRSNISRLPSQLVETSRSMASRFSGRSGMLRAKYVNDAFVEKICAVCGKGSNGERLQRCVRCSKIYYCGRVCQAGDWQRHKRNGCVAV